MPTKINYVYKCNVCGNIVEVVHAAGGTLVCCEQEMALQIENTVDASKEKHVPVVKRVADGYEVLVGSVEHPMEEKHYIEWIELISDNLVLRSNLKPGMKPYAKFTTPELKDVYAREYCNLHGLWKGE